MATLLFYATGALGGLAKLLQAWYGDSTGTAFQDLICGIPGNKAALEGEAMFELALRIRESDELKALFSAHPKAEFFAVARRSERAVVRAFMTAYDEFIRAHGHRGTRTGISTTTGGSRIRPLDYDALSQLLDTDNPVHPAVLMEKLVSRRESVSAEICAKLSAMPFGSLRVKDLPLRRRLLPAFSEVSGRRTPLSRSPHLREKESISRDWRRMTEQGLLDAPDDFWFLARHELYDYLNGKAPAALCRAKMAARKRVFHRRNERLEPTPTWIRNDMPVDLSGAVASTADLPEGTLVGIATSYGIATGVSRIVPQLDQIGRVQNGDILICNSTDPGWMSVFRRSAGSYLKTGGMLAHGACLSREYGIPAVQVRDAMRQVPDAVQITVDGNAARVYPALAS